jgi:two-component system phosphate regulon sensor histidine kinase PhoR
MQKKVIPLLIILMSLSLVGIVYIQYLWIQKSVNEKQALIDKNVILAVENVEEQLNDHQTFSYFSSSTGEIDFENLIDIGESVQFDSEGNIDSSDQIKVKIMSHHDSDVILGEQQIIIEENIGISEEGSIDSIEWKHELHKIDHLINKVKIELLGEEETRLDSSKVKSLLTEEFKANELGEIVNWGIYDEKQNKYSIQPLTSEITDYQIPLFSTDVIHPKRFELHLSLDNSNLLWSEIWSMIVLSLVFLSVIIIVFAYSIKLVIKHKKISEIKSDFMNNMTHEFKTPLASISLAADSLLHPNAKIDESHIQKYVSIIQEEKSKLNSQVERILELAALNKEVIDIPVQSIKLDDIISSAIQNLSLLVEREKAQISHEKNEKTKVYANKFHLEKVVVNLIENAIKYSESPAEIKINTKEEGEFIVIQITDKGIGMNAYEVSKAFDDFYRAETGNLHNTKGFGLGLSYCKMVINKMGGDIKLKSKINQGTTVEVKVKIG